MACLEPVKVEVFQSVTAPLAATMLPSALPTLALLILALLILALLILALLLVRTLLFLTLLTALFLAFLALLTTLLLRTLLFLTFLALLTTLFLAFLALLTALLLLTLLFRALLFLALPIVAPLFVALPIVALPVVAPLIMALPIIALFTALITPLLFLLPAPLFMTRLIALPLIAHLLLLAQAFIFPLFPCQTFTFHAQAFALRGHAFTFQPPVPFGIVPIRLGLFVGRIVIVIVVIIVIAGIRVALRGRRHVDGDATGQQQGCRHACDDTNGIQFGHGSPPRAFLPMRDVALFGRTKGAALHFRRIFPSAFRVKATGKSIVPYIRLCPKVREKFLWVFGFGCKLYSASALRAAH